MNEFHIDDVPDNTTIIGFIEQHSDMKKMVERFSNYPDNAHMLPISVSATDALWESIQEAFDIHGWYGFLLANFNPNNKNRSNLYGGFSITHNINCWQDLPVNAQTLGNYRYNLEDIFDDEIGKTIWDNISLNEHTLQTKTLFYDKVEHFGLYVALEELYKWGFLTIDQYKERREKYKNCKIDQEATKQRKKNTYSDTLGFSWRTPASQHGLLGEFLDSSPRTHVRGRVVTLRHPQGVHWHTDESIFYNTRINIPVYSTISCKAYIGDKSWFWNNPGNMYCWDTGIPHKIDIIDYDGVGERTAIVCGFSPWWDFNQETQIWKKNEFYGVAHPLEIFDSGHFLNTNIFITN